MKRKNPNSTSAPNPASASASTPISVLSTISIAMTGNTVAEILTLPITVIRVVYQTNNITLKDTIVQIKNRSGFYNGGAIALLSKALSISMKYTIYRKIKDYRGTEKDDLVGNCFNGFLCGVIGTTVTNPLMVWRTQRQRGELMKLGYAYRGLMWSIIRCIPLYSLLFPVFDYYNNKLQNPILAAGCTNLSIFPVTQPFDYIRTRKAAGKKTPLTWKIFRYYKGGTLAILRNMPHLMISMTIIDRLSP